MSVISDKKYPFLDSVASVPGGVQEYLSQLQVMRKKRDIDYALQLDAIVYAIECYLSDKAWQVWYKESVQNAFVRSDRIRSITGLVVTANSSEAEELSWSSFTWPAVLVDILDTCHQRLKTSFIDTLLQWHSLFGGAEHGVDYAAKIISYQRHHGQLDTVESIEAAKRSGLDWLCAMYARQTSACCVFTQECEALNTFYEGLLYDMAFERKLESFALRMRQDNKDHPYGVLAKGGLGLFAKPKVFALHVEDFYAKAQKKRRERASFTPQTVFVRPTTSLELSGSENTFSVSPIQTFLDYDGENASLMPRNISCTPGVGIIGPQGQLAFYPLGDKKDDEALLNAMHLHADSNVVVHVANDSTRLLTLLTKLERVVQTQGISCTHNNILVPRCTFAPVPSQYVNMPGTI